MRRGDADRRETVRSSRAALHPEPNAQTVEILVGTYTELLWSKPSLEAPYCSCLGIDPPKTIGMLCGFKFQVLA